MKSSATIVKVFLLGLIWLLFTSFLETPNGNKLATANNTKLLELNTDGLYYAEFYDYIFRGHFEELDIARDDMQFLMIFSQYLRAYGAQCSGALPSNKVEIMNEECATEEVTRNGWGDVVSRVCIKYVWVGSGLYAKPGLYEAYGEIDQIQRSKGLGTMMKMITDPNSMGNSVDMMHKTNGLKNDMVKIFKLNTCQSPGLQRFEENLKLFALNKPGIRMDEASKYTTMKKSGGPTGNQDYAKLIDDLVYDQAKTWSFNRYTSGSISGVTTSSRDKQGRPVELSASYSFSGFSGNSKGSVRIVFKNGLPNCIYFYDFPQNCKSPNSSILSAYAQGEYTY
ncbi:hypothetical protein [Maribacter ulvicola]|uniref:Uncharacterized protein n=1 Tax=Maribacter ulvicola TaxID=228959 RepID=A0A1N6YSW4_9FLAO|nr:hypothetical protein [Maribacter ulvicola]SIR17758.1 hypothetical protein SAMN05421797_107133 [Maribacter ulvicola]